MMFGRLFQATLLASLFLHFGLSLYLYVVDSGKAPVSETIELTLQEPVVNDDAAKLKQIVQQNPEALNDEKDPNAKFLSEHDQRVVEQTRAQTHGDFKNAQVKDMQESKQAKQEKKSKMKQMIAADQKTASGLPVLDALKPNFDWDRMDKIGGSKRETASKTDDYLKEVKDGAQTMLSTREFLYYSYYNRIRGQLKQYWEPRIKEKVKKIFATGRSIASDEDRITRVLIVLNDAGTLVKVQVVGESGVRDLDDAAVEAFRQAAPFPNPPKGIVDTDGLIKIRWDFILEA